VAQLNEASRELASLRAANAKLRAEKSSAPAPAPTTSSSSSRSTPADDRLNQTLRSYAQFRQELTAIVADLEKLRSDNATLSSQLKEASTKAQQASSVATKLERELSAERDARVDAEKTIASLREQLRAVAKAVKEAGVPLDPAARSGR
jgi:chromosome segregation ATPase